MQPTVILGTGDKLGAITINIDQRQIVRDILSNLRQVFGANGMRRKMLILFAVVGFVARLKARSRHNDRERREREKAKIWSEEMKSK